MQMMALALALHVLAAIVWVGGMFMLYVCVRPAVSVQLAPPERLPLLAEIMRRFFVWVWAAVIVLPATGFWMAWIMFDAPADWPLSVHVMMGGGLLMIALYLRVWFGPWRRFRRALAAADLSAASGPLAGIRHIVAVNLVLGMLVAAVAAGGRWF
jgi:uncharacterized membrane protein